MSSGFRTPADADYLNGLGRAMYTFATLEWQVVWCCELISPGFVRDVSAMTAGQIAKSFQRLAATLPASAEAAAMGSLAKQFGELVGTRNDIAHANPGTQEGTGAQLLFRHGTPLETPDLDAATRKFEECSGELNRLFYNYLRVSIRPASGSTRTQQR
jgi:phage tail protein X